MKNRILFIIVITICTSYLVFPQNYNSLKLYSPPTKNKGLAVIVVTLGGIGLGAALGASAYMLSHKEHHPQDLWKYAGIGAAVGGTIALIVGVAAAASNDALINSSQNKFTIKIPNVSYDYQTDKTTVSILKMRF